MTTYPWSGKGKSLDDYDIPRIAYTIGVGEDEIHAVLDVETKGTGYDENGVIRLFEEHVFYRQLPEQKRAEAVSKGIAYPKWRRNYKDNYNRFLQAYDFDPTAALRSCSWGLGQVMGFNSQMCGYLTALDMVKAFAKSESDQLQAMITFIKTSRLDGPLRDHNWAKFAEGYNGAGYKANKYDERLAQRFAWWQKRPDTKWSPVIAEVESDFNDLPPTASAGKPLTQSPTIWAAISSAIASTVPVFAGLDWKVIAVLSTAIIVASSLYIIYRRVEMSKTYGV